jgi:hypothetical protein
VRGEVNEPNRGFASGWFHSSSRITGNPEVIRSSVGLVLRNALVATELSTSIDWPETGFWVVSYESNNW